LQKCLRVLKKLAKKHVRVLKMFAKMSEGFKNIRKKQLRLLKKFAKMSGD